MVGQKTVLLALDKDTSGESVREFLRQMHVVPVECSDGIDALRKALSKDMDLILLDTDLSRLNGYQCARMIKADPTMGSSVIVHMGHSDNPIDQYWSRICGGDAYLKIPVSESDLTGMMHQFSGRKRRKTPMLSSLSPMKDLDDQAVMTLATRLLEHDLIRVNILNELSMLNTWHMFPKDVVVAITSIIGSIFTFSMAAVLLIYENHSSLYFCANGSVDQERQHEIKKLISRHLERQDVSLFDQGQIAETLLPMGNLREREQGYDEIYIHTKSGGPVRTVLAFEDMGVDELGKDDRQSFSLALDLAHGVLEKKIFSQISQELSVIDAETKGYSMAFFMGVLEREIESATRNKYPITLFTLGISNLPAIAGKIPSEQVDDLLFAMQKIILRTMRKSDIVARWAPAHFAFFLTHVPLDHVEIPLKRMLKHMEEESKRCLPPSLKAEFSEGVRQFDPETDLSPDIFLERAKPDRSSREKNVEKVIQGEFRGIYNASIGEKGS